MSFERHPGSIAGLSDDQLGTVAVSLVVGELQWSPDVAPAVLDRISRDAVAYPEHLDRRVAAPAPRPSAMPFERSAKRTIGRLAVFGVILVVIIAIVAFAATASASDVGPDGLRAEPIRAIDGTLVSFGVDERDELYLVGRGDRILHVVTEAS